MSSLLNEYREVIHYSGRIEEASGRLGLAEKQKTKFFMEKWKRLCEEKRLEAEREEKRLEAERDREKKRLEAECEEKHLEIEREHKLTLRRIESKRVRLEFLSKKGERENRSDVAEKNPKKRENCSITKVTCLC